MKKLSKLAVSVMLTAAVLTGTALSGCAQGSDYTQEIRDYQSQLESLQEENEALKEQLETTEETAETESIPETETLTESATETAETTEAAAAESVAEENAQEEEEDKTARILVFGDSIWDNERNETGVAAQVEMYMRIKGYEPKVYNAAVGGTRATIDYNDSEWDYGEKSNASFGMMTSAFTGHTDIELLQGKNGYEDLKEAIAYKDKMDYVVIAYGMNDFLNRVPLNDSDRHWCGYGTALREGIGRMRLACPSAKIVLVTPTYGSYFPNGAQNMGDLALFNYVKVARQVAEEEGILCMDAYDNLGIDAYNADEYLEDGVHLSQKGRNLYAKGLVSCMLAGYPGTVSGNNLIFTEEE